MSSCFLCDCSYKFTEGNDQYNVVSDYGESEKRYMKQLPIMVGSTGTGVNDQQHKDNRKQNYVSYRVKKIEFRASVFITARGSVQRFPDYILIFKVPFREPVFDYHFVLLGNFMLFSEPESVLKYGVYTRHTRTHNNGIIQYTPDRFDLIVDKPFVVGPNDYVGVFYMFFSQVNVDASARVWFDVV